MGLDTYAARPLGEIGLRFDGFTQIGLFDASSAQVNSLDIYAVQVTPRLQLYDDPLLQGIALSLEIIECGTDENAECSGYLCHIYPLFMKT